MIPAIGEPVQLTAEEAQHTAARRLRAGDSVQLIDGNGTRAMAVISQVGERNKPVCLNIQERHIEASPALSLELVAALPKGDRQAIMVDMAVQLGVTHLTPLRCQHSLVVGNSNHRRWRKIALEACKQSGRAWLPQLLPMQGLEEVLEDCLQRGVFVCMAHPQARDSVANCQQMAKGRDVCLLVGPQGGFTDSEVAQAQQHGAATVQLGEAILRVETAAVVLLSVFSSVRWLDSQLESPSAH